LGVGNWDEGTLAILHNDQGEAAQNRLVIPHLKKKSEYPTSSAFSQKIKRKNRLKSLDDGLVFLV